MKQWYLFYAKSAEKLAQLGRELPSSKKLAQLGREINETTAVSNDEVQFPDYFAFVPWKHHVDKRRLESKYVGELSPCSLL